MAEGHSANQVILQLHDTLINMDELTDAQKSVIFEKLAVSPFYNEPLGQVQVGFSFADCG